MKTIVTIREDRVTLRMPGADIKDDGTIWLRGIPLIDGKIECGMDIDALKILVKSRRWNEIPEEAYARFGKNSSGLRVMYEEDWRDEVQSARSEADKDYEQVFVMQDAYYRARKADYYDPDRIYSLKHKAEKAEKAWREKYPEAARGKDRQILRDQAARKRELAQGALFYDADGWFDEGGKQKRHDEFIAAAEKLEDQADNL